MAQNNIFTISQINNYISGIFAENRTLLDVSVKGEISNCKYHSSGHIYFTLKDSGSQLSAVMWRTQAFGLKVKLTDGMQVVAHGRIAAYEKGGIYQLYADSVVADGVGALYEVFEKLKARLNAEGLFAPEHKKPLPAFAKNVGIVTASTGAAVQDIISISKRRNPYIKLIMFPAKVQGEGAAKSVIKGIKALEKVKPDVIIIGRGGGSMEDLFEFNDEELARVIYDCEIPIISAVGHETDFTIADFVADRRAATPSAAAELAVCEINAILSSLVDLRFDLRSAMERKLIASRDAVENKRIRLKSASPSEKIKRKKQDVEAFSKLLKTLMTKKTEAEKSRVLADIKALEALSPLKRLEAGYAYVTNGEGHNIKSVKEVKVKDRIDVKVTDGVLKAEVLDIE